MGGVPTKHHSKSKVGRRRSQLGMKKVNVIPCPECGGPALPHKICPQCGTYVKVAKSKPQTSNTTQQ
jgi:large subunit ribosomal protein L32